MKTLRCALLLAAVLLASCKEPFGVRDNPVDPGAATYQGYQAVGSVGAVVPDSPGEGASLVWLTFVCSWCASADLYGIRIADAGETVVYEWNDFPANAFALSDVSLPAGSYTWSVRAREAGGAWGPWSAARSVVVTAGIAGDVVPADSRVTTATTPLLEWGGVEGAVSYELQIADSAPGLDGTTPVAVVGSGYQVTAPLAYGTWYWRVRAVNQDGVASAWSAICSFGVGVVDMVRVAGGSFSMGSTEGEPGELPVHSVTVSSVLIATYEVTQGQYQAAMGSNPSEFVGDTSRPVETVTWYNAVAFCNVLSALEGLQQVYTIDGTTVSVDLTRNGYRLPTEAEWEFAALGGTASHGYTYSGSNTLGDVAWYSGNSGATTHAVGTKAANELGIHDMSGNVWEWCWDWFGSYPSGAQTDPAGPTSGSSRVLRGGAWECHPSYGVFCTYRRDENPDVSMKFFGFRVVRSAE